MKYHLIRIPLMTLVVALLASCQRTPETTRLNVFDPFDCKHLENATEIADMPNLQRLTIGSLNSRGQVVIDFSNRSNYARAFWVNGKQTPSPGAIKDFDVGKPATLTLQLDASGETVLCMVFGGTYMSNHAARVQLPDGSVVPNNPVVEYNGSARDIIDTWKMLSKTNESFRIELLDETKSNELDFIK